MTNLKQLRLTLLSTLWLVGTLWPTTLWAEQFINSANPLLHYMGRIDKGQPQGAYLSWPGNSVTFTFTGNRLVLALDDDSGNNYYNVIFNGEDTTPYVLKANKGLHQYDLSHKIVSQQTHVTLFKRTEGEEGGTYFNGITLADDGKLLAQASHNPLRIIYYGDSVTVGMGNEAAHNTGDGNPAEKNHYLSYAAITARNLDAELHSIAKSGIGFMVSWFDFAMPAYYDQLTGESNNKTIWPFEQWQPDIVVVNLGQNDKWLIENEHRLEKSPQEIIEAYQAFIQTLRAHHPSAYFICALGSMDATSNNTWPGYVETAVANIKSSAAQSGHKANIDTVMFDFTGYGAHPRVDQHRQNAEKLTAFIQSKLPLL